MSTAKWRDGAAWRAATGRALGVALLAMCVVATGCAKPGIRGLVIEGRPGGMAVLEPGDKQIKDVERYGLAGAVIEVTIDPHSGNPERLGAYKTDDQGRFAAPVDKIGAGLLEYEVGLLVYREGFEPQWKVMKLPSSKKVVLVTLEPGNKGTLNVDLLRQTMRDMPAFD
ncbi:MAG: hypothetical protein IT442_04200 [Phycisphaeraceae bacterium]|nr:hypothetical protein [Phycisphaeraceae bacterium]